MIGRVKTINLKPIGKLLIETNNVGIVPILDEIKEETFPMCEEA